MPYRFNRRNASIISQSCPDCDVCTVHSSSHVSQQWNDMSKHCCPYKLQYIQDYPGTIGWDMFSYSPCAPQLWANCSAPAYFQCCSHVLLLPHTTSKEQNCHWPCHVWCFSSTSTGLLHCVFITQCCSGMYVFTCHSFANDTCFLVREE